MQRRVRKGGPLVGPTCGRSLAHGWDYLRQSGGPPPNPWAETRLLREPSSVRAGQREIRASPLHDIAFVRIPILFETTLPRGKSQAAASSCFLGNQPLDGWHKLDRDGHHGECRIGVGGVVFSSRRRLVKFETGGRSAPGDPNVTINDSGPHRKGITAWQSTPSRQPTTSGSSPCGNSCNRQQFLRPLLQ